MKRLALALILAGGPALAQERPHAPDAAVPAHAAPEPSKPVLTADEGKKLYEYGLKVGIAQGMARAAMQAAQQEAKPVLEKLQQPQISQR